VLVVISDIHFQDTVNDAIVDNNSKTINIDRNVSVDAFKKTFDEIVSAAEDNRANELIIVLAGDIFDIHRSQKWLETDFRPYGKNSPAQWGPIAENILEDIISCNKAAINALKEVFNNPPRNLRKIEVLYFPGNHDRLVNLYPPLRKRVRELLRNPADPPATANPPFEHYYSSNDYGVLVFHGHEYDSTNFAGKVPAGGVRKIDVDCYDLPTLGDYITIDVAASLAHEYRKLYEQELRSNATHQAIFCKLLEFDDVRPQSDLLDFLQEELPFGQDCWKFILPVFNTIVRKAWGNDFLKSKLGFWGKIVGILPPQVVPSKLLIDMMFAMKSRGKPPCERALDDGFLSETAGRYVAAGHTHCPTIEFLKKREDNKELFFFNTGTWRQQIRKCVDKKTFSRAKALTYVAFYRQDEDPSRKKARKGYSFDYWSGFTKKEIIA
jgi:UDP-2,3-diacylglucosamine pyrophosphatase LpxH